MSACGFFIIVIISGLSSADNLNIHSHIWHMVQRSYIFNTTVTPDEFYVRTTHCVTTRDVFIFQKNDRSVMKTTTKKSKTKRSFFKNNVFKNERFSKRSFFIVLLTIVNDDPSLTTTPSLTIVNEERNPTWRASVLIIE